MITLDWPLTATPKIRTAGRFPLSDRGFATTYRGPSHALHLHDYAGSMRLEGMVVDLLPGDLTLSPAGRASGYDLPQPGRHWCVHFWPEAGDAVLRLPAHVRLGSGAIPVRDRLARIAMLHARAAEQGAAGALAAASASIALQGLLLSLAERANAGPVRGDRDVEAAVDTVAAAIDARFDEPLTAAALVNDTGFSHNHLGRRFRARFGVTIAHRILQRRVEHARFLLEATDLPIWRVGERVGIPDPHHFNKTVRRMTGRSPSQLRADAGGRVLFDPDR
jgi:AraC-like DNA-binding protein